MHSTGYRMSPIWWLEGRDSGTAAEEREREREEVVKRGTDSHRFLSENVSRGRWEMVERRICE